jgi:transcription factor STE12
MADHSNYRHRRTHDRSDGSEGPYGSYSGEEEDYEGEDQLGPLEEASPNSENGYLPTTMAQSFNGLSSMGMTTGMSNSGMAAPSQLISHQMMMQQPI